MTAARTVLFSETAQNVVIGAALEDNSLMKGPLTDLAVSDFVGETARAVYTEMLRASEDGEPFDPITVFVALERRGEADRLSVVGFLAQCLDGLVSSSGIIQRHKETIQRLATLRRLGFLAENLEKAVFALDADPNVVLKNLASEVSSLQAGYDGAGNLLPYAPRDPSSQPEIIALSHFQPMDVRWLWEPYLPFGMLGMISGDPGVGKTFIVMAIAAAATVGKIPFVGASMTPTDVLYLSVENSPEYVLRPRFDALGGNPKRFHLLRGSVRSPKGQLERGCIRLSDVALLETALGQTHSRLLIVDPIQSYLGAEVDLHRSNETRPVLDGLCRLAEAHQCSIVLVRHLSKALAGRAVHRGLGSIDLTGAVRTELLAGSLADDPGQRALVHLKSNLGHLGPSIGYEIGTDGLFRWTGISRLTASEIQAPENTSQAAGAIADAKKFLLEELAKGPLSVEAVQHDAEAEGISQRTLRRAKEDLNVRSQKADRRWMWALPEGSQDGQDGQRKGDTLIGKH